MKFLYASGSILYALSAGRGHVPARTCINSSHQPDVQLDEEAAMLDSDTDVQQVFFEFFDLIIQRE